MILVIDVSNFYKQDTMLYQIDTWLGIIVWIDFEDSYHTHFPTIGPKGPNIVDLIHLYEAVTRRYPFIIQIIMVLFCVKLKFILHHIHLHIDMNILYYFLTELQTIDTFLT